MKLSNQSPAAIASELGERLKQARLNANITQEALAQRAGVSLKVLRGAEKGKAQLVSFIAIMGGLGLIDQLETFLPTQTISPLQLVALKGSSRIRATAHVIPAVKEDPEW